MSSTIISNAPTATVVKTTESFWKLTRIALLVGITGLLIAGYGIYSGLTTSYSRHIISWLIGFSFWFAVIIGMLFLIMISYIFGAKWSIILRRQLEHGIGAFPYLFVIFLPLALIPWFYTEDPGILWKWMNPDKVIPGDQTVGSDVLYQHKAGYLNLSFFTFRVVAFFACWTFLAGRFRKYSFEMDKNPQKKWASLPVKWAAAGLPLAAITMTLAAIDWFKSLDYHWFSTMYGVWYFALSVRLAVAVTILLCAWQVRRGALKGIYNSAHQYDLCCLLLAFTIFWAYISFSQYFLIYNANIPEETFWYNIRELNASQDGKNSWWWVSMALIFCNFLIPFLALLSFKLKVTKGAIFVSIWVLIFTLSDIYFNISPGMVADESAPMGFTVKPFKITVYDVASIIGVGGIVFFAYLRSLEKQKIIPIHDPRIDKSIHRHL